MTSKGARNGKVVLKMWWFECNPLKISDSARKIRLMNRLLLEELENYYISPVQNVP